MTITVSALFLVIALLPGLSPETQLPFNTEVWNRNGDNNDRLRMVEDLRLKLVGHNKAAVRKLLGEPITDLQRFPGDYYYYGLGTRKRLFDTDGIWLCIKFRNGQTDVVQVACD